jgi:DNA polymerase III subunit delta'
MSFKDIINQQKAKDIISGQLRSDKVPHAYLFLGEEGTGRKKTALELAKALNCAEKGADACGKCASCVKIAHSNHPDVQLIDFEFQARLENKDVEKQRSIKIDTIRALQKEVSLKPAEGRWKVFIIEPAEKITLDAANCLLKTLEEPPGWTLLILLAKNRENLPATVVSRTQIIPFAPLSEKEVAGFLQSELSIDLRRALDIAKRSRGSLSEALSLAEDDSGTLAEVWQGIKDNSLSCAELLVITKENAKNASEFIRMLEIEVRTDFEKQPQIFSRAMESIIASRKFISRNANPQMVLDDLIMSVRIKQG